MRLFLARHAETVYNADARMQGQTGHTPLTRAGFAQAEAMGSCLASVIGAKADIDLWASPAGRTLQTAAVIAEHLGRSFFDIRRDPRLLEIDVGQWAGRRYADIVAEQGSILCAERALFTAVPPGGETYAMVADRAAAWLGDLDPGRDVLAITHGMTLRVLLGLLVGGESFGGTVIAASAPQGTVFAVEDGRVQKLHVGLGQSVAAPSA